MIPRAQNTKNVKLFPPKKSLPLGLGNNATHDPG